MEPTAPTSIFAYDSYVVNVANTPTTLDKDALIAFAPKFASVCINGTTTGLKAAGDNDTKIAYVEMYYVTIDTVVSGNTTTYKYALVGFVRSGDDDLKFGVAGFDASGKVNDVKFYSVIGDGESKIDLSASFMGIKSGNTILFGVESDTSGAQPVHKFMLPPKSFFLDGIHVNPFEPFPATTAAGLTCVPSGVIALAASA